MPSFVSRTPSRIVLATFVLVAAHLPARAQGTGRSTDIDVSIRSAALGGASNALFWGDELDHWANPALLGGVTGIRYEHGHTPLVPGLSTDVKFMSDVVKIGGGGIGLVLSGQPGGLGGVKLDYGESVATDPGGNVIGTFGSYEEVKSWGFGLSALQALGSVPALRGGIGRFAQYGDVSFGMNFKDIKIALAPSSTSGEGSTTARDWGMLVRATPLDGISQPGPLPLRLDIAFGHSVLSYNDDATITFINEDMVDRVTRHRRDGWAIRLAFDPPSMRPGNDVHDTWRAFLAGLHPLFSAATTIDNATIDAGSGTSEYPTEGHGVEIELARVFTYRTGHYTDRAGDIDGSTSGWRLALPIGHWGGGYYEEATWPQSASSNLPDVTRTGWGMWLDALAIWRSTHARSTTSTATETPHPIPKP